MANFSPGQKTTTWKGERRYWCGDTTQSSWSDCFRRCHERFQETVTLSSLCLLLSLTFFLHWKLHGGKSVPVKFIFQDWTDYCDQLGAFIFLTWGMTAYWEDLYNALGAVPWLIFHHYLIVEALVTLIFSCKWQRWFYQVCRWGYQKVSTKSFLLQCC